MRRHLRTAWLARPDDLGFQVEEKPLAGQTAGVAGQLPARADDAMAGDQKAHRVPADGGADLLRSRAVSQLAGQVSVGDGLAVGDLADQ